MAKAIYKQRGEALDYTNNTGADVEAGDVVVMGGIIGVAGTNIPVGATGSLHVMGVYVFPKGTGAIAAGTALRWDAITGQAVEGDGVPLGYAAEDAEADAGDVAVLLCRSAAVEESGG